MGKKEEVSVGLVVLTILFAIIISFAVSLATINIVKPATTFVDSSIDSGAIIVRVAERDSSGGIIKVEVIGK